MSDHEVNYKILLAGGGAGGPLAAVERSAVLRACLDEAAADVLAHNASQSLCLSLDLHRAAEAPERIADAAGFLVRHAELDAALEGLPEDGSAATWTRPDLAILLSYSKLLAKRALALSDVIDQPALAPLLRSYFPPRLRDAFAPALESHRLRREIKALVLVNRVIDRAGVTLIPELSRTLAVDASEVLAAYWTADQLLDADALRAAADAGSATEAGRVGARLRVENALREAAALGLGLERRALLAPDELRQRRESLAELRSRVAPGRADLDALPLLVRAQGALVASLRSGAPLAHALELWSELGERTRIAWLLDRLACVDGRDAWSRIGAASIALDVTRLLCELCERELASTGAERASRRAELETRIAASARLAAEIESGQRGLAPLLVLSQRIRRLC